MKKIEPKKGNLRNKNRNLSRKGLCNNYQEGGGGGAKMSFTKGKIRD